MNITVVGAGYVGLITAVCFSEVGNNVVCVDIDENKVNQLNQGIPILYENQLESMLNTNLKAGRISFTTHLDQALDNSNIIYIAVNTPMDDDGSADLQYVEKIAEQIGQIIDKELFVIIKSTVPVGTCLKVKNIILEQMQQRAVTHTIHIISNPEFLKEGSAIKDCMSPDRIVIGVEDTESEALMNRLYVPFTTNHKRIFAMKIASSEMTKYAANAMLATKISFINDIANLCEKVGADVNDVRVGIGSDQRIGYHFIYPGSGYGGSCFPKDVKALINTAKKYNYDMRILEAVEDVNNDQKTVLSKKVINRFGSDLTGLEFALWGLSFKPNTDDIRESTALVVIDELCKKGAKIKAYDPQAKNNTLKYYQDKEGINLEICDNKYDTLKDSSAMLLVTEWLEFRSPDFKQIEQLLKNKIIFDGRNQYNLEQMIQMGYEYYAIGI